jgi:hypothetical protein
LLLAVLLCLGTAGLALAYDSTLDRAQQALLAPATSPALCYKLTAPLTIDGQSNEWAATPGLILDANTAQYVGGAPDSAEDASAALRCAWDTQNLYFFVAVANDVLLADSSTVWDDDSLEIALDGARDRACCSADDVQLTFAVDGRIANFGTVESGLAVRFVVVAESSNRYAIEAAVPLTMFLPGPPASGAQIGFNWGLNDDDDGGRRDTHLVWAGSTILNYPQFGDLLLTGPYTGAPTTTRTATATASATAAPATTTPSRTATTAATATPTTGAPAATSTATPTTGAPAATPTASATPTTGAVTATPTSPAATATPVPTASGTPLADRLADLEKNMGGLGDALWAAWQIMQAAGGLTGGAPIAGTVTPTATATPPVSGYRVLVRCGGETYVDSQGQAWLADQTYVAGSWGYVGGGSYSTTVAINGTVDDPLYQAERYNMISYQFDVPPGSYRVELHFAEIYQYAAPNQRVFDVLLEGTAAISALDLYSVAGHYTAYSRSVEVAVLDGQLNMDFVVRKGAAKISAIKVTGLAPAGPTPTPSLGQRISNLESYISELERLFQQILQTFDEFLRVP